MAAVRVERAAAAAGAEGLVGQAGSAAGTVEEEREVGERVEDWVGAEEVVAQAVMVVAEKAVAFP